MKYKAKLINGKLMLISSDIQVGDKVYAPDYKLDSDILEESQPDPWYVLANLYDVKNFKDQKSFKVIGEISDQATWVKEGDEFDEKEWKTEGGFFETIRIKIKGPCGHFH